MPDIAVAIGTLAAAAALAALATAIAAFISLRRLRAHCATLESNLAALGREIGMAASIYARTGSRVKRIEQEFSDVADRVELIESRARRDRSTERSIRPVVAPTPAASRSNSV